MRAIRSLRSGRSADLQTRFPFSPRATTTLITIRNSGYSQPPFGALNTQPLPTCTQVAPSSTGIEAERDPARADAEHQQDAADRFEREHDVGEERRQADRCEVLRRAREREREVLQHDAVRDEHDAESDAQQRRAPTRLQDRICVAMSFSMAVRVGLTARPAARSSPRLRSRLPSPRPGCRPRRTRRPRPRRACRSGCSNR